MSQNTEYFELSEDVEIRVLEYAEHQDKMQLEFGYLVVALEDGLCKRRGDKAKLHRTLIKTAKYKGLDASTIRHRVRVCRAIPREFTDEFPELDFGRWCAVLAAGKEPSDWYPVAQWCKEMSLKEEFDFTLPTPTRIREHIKSLTNTEPTEPEWYTRADRMVASLEALIGDAKVRIEFKSECKAFAAIVRAELDTWDAWTPYDE